MSKSRIIRLPIALQQGVMSCLRQKLQQANQRLATHYSEPKVNYRQNGTIAGSAWPLQWEMRLNPVLLLENSQAFIEHVVPHELAHLLVYKRFGQVAPHGAEWIWMMEQILDTPAHRTHPFDTDSVSGPNFTYRCDCQLHQLTLRRHNRIMRNQCEYRCKKCSAVLLPDPQQEKT